MIIERALKELFKSISVNNREVQFNYGTQRELNQWITFRNQQQLAKFPLIWYVSNDYSEDDGMYRINNARIIVFMNTEYNWLNETRAVKTFESWIEPIVSKVVRSLKSNVYINVKGANNFDKFRYRSISNYGVPTDVSSQLQSNSFKGSQPKNEKSITTDIVDAILIDFNFEIKPHCIIK